MCLTKVFPNQTLPKIIYGYKLFRKLDDSGYLHGLIYDTINPDKPGHFLELWLGSKYFANEYPEKIRIQSNAFEVSAECYPNGFHICETEEGANAFLSWLTFRSGRLPNSQEVILKKVLGETIVAVGEQDCDEFGKHKTYVSKTMRIL